MHGPEFHSGQCPDRLWGQPNFLLNGVGFSLSGVQQTGSEFDHLAPYTDLLKCNWNFNATALIPCTGRPLPLPSLHLLVV
jgi:hypothetical protein